MKKSKTVEEMRVELKDNGVYEAAPPNEMDYVPIDELTDEQVTSLYIAYILGAVHETVDEKEPLSN